MRIAVTGATGFIGCHLVSFLKSKGHYVRAIGRREVVMRKTKYEQADEVVIANLLQPDEAQRALSGMEWVFHLAADMGGVEYIRARKYYPFIYNMTIDSWFGHFPRSLKKLLHEMHSLVHKAVNTSDNSRDGVHLVQVARTKWGMNTNLMAFLAQKWGIQFIY